MSWPIDVIAVKLVRRASEVSISHFVSHIGVKSAGACGTVRGRSSGKGSLAEGGMVAIVPGGMVVFRRRETAAVSSPLLRHAVMLYALPSPKEMSKRAGVVPGARVDILSRAPSGSARASATPSPPNSAANASFARSTPSVGG